MSSSKIPFTITYKKPGTVPPLFLAGSFSDPEWQPKEMEYRTEEDGEHAFQSEVMVKPGEDYQFKLRIGDDWWILAENYAVATDDSGNQNNVVAIPKPSSGEEDALTDKNDSSVNAKADGSSPPIPTPQLRVPESDSAKDTAEELKMPLFAHECLGAYDFEEEESEEEACPGISPRREAKPNSSDYIPADVDLNDPTIEKFPSDRTSILDALRTIQTHLGEDQPHVADLPTSPRVVSSSRPSIDSTDDMSLSPIPISPNSTRKRENRLSHSSFGRSRSVVSLGSIAEEPKPDTKESQGPAVISLPNPNTASTHEEPRSPPSEEDEAVVMKSSEANSTDKASKMPLSQDASIEAVALDNKFVAKGLRLYSARSVANRTKTFVAKKNKVVAPKKTVAPVATVEKVFGKGKRVIAAKSAKFAPSIPAEVKSSAAKKVQQKATLRKSITPGTVLIVLAGRFAGKRVVALKQLDSGLILITGPFKVNGVPLRRIDQRYVIATSTKINVSGVTVAANINDAYFNAEKKSTKKSEGAFFSDEKKTEKKKIADTRVADQKSVDAAILAVLKKEKFLTVYLKTKFYLKKGEFAHNLKF